ncbi:alpha/beta fold hydrolase [Nocardia bovistercoris]|uniref:Alpha/beta hydrolase n=1 Tax=Nocardia bovistercoris TaxID=2785916 RepID=A0A931N783_9NOCA|nr:alpha/beta hydrolase [Nocardia bovistercoris]MBH0781326.1 alpha/beta hydrolase [Nocardia bovistercoris]
MLVTSMQTIAALRGTEPLTAAYRAGLRGRAYATAALNKPTAPHEVIPVTTADGARLRVHAYGRADAPTIVLVHGWSCSIEYWYPQINAFADRYRVLTYDQRGHGESGLGRSRLGAASLASDLNAVLHAGLARGERAVLVGHSMGGMTIQAWAARYPDQVAERASEIVLVNTAAREVRGETDMLPLLNKPLTVGARPVTLCGSTLRMPSLVAETVLFSPVPVPGGRLVSAVFKNRVMNKDATDDQVAFALAVIRACRPLTRGLHAAALVDLDLGDSATHISVPTTVIAGSADLLLPERMSRHIVEILDRNGVLADYHVWPTGHLGTIEAADRFDAVLERVAARASRWKAAAV